MVPIFAMWMATSFVFAAMSRFEERWCHDISAEKSDRGCLRLPAHDRRRLTKFFSDVASENADELHVHLRVFSTQVFEFCETDAKYSRCDRRSHIDRRRATREITHLPRKTAHANFAERVVADFDVKRAFDHDGNGLSAGIFYWQFVAFVERFKRTQLQQSPEFARRQKIENA